MKRLSIKTRSVLCIVLSCAALAAQAGHELSAITGDKIRVYDGQMLLQGVRCPNLDSEAGKAAQRLANIYLHGKHVYCEVTRNESAEALGDCKLRFNNGNTLSQMLIASGYCEKRLIETKCDTTAKLLFECGV